MSSNIRIEKICEECLQSFIAKTTVTKYCSDRCAKRAYKKREREKKAVETGNLSEQLGLIINQRINAKEYFSISEVMSMLKVSRSTVYRAIRNDRLEVLRLGTRVIIPRASLKNLIRNDDKA